VKEEGVDLATGKVVVSVDARYHRPTEVDTLLGDSSKAREKLGWKPRTTFADLVKEMVRKDLEICKRDVLVQEKGYRTIRNHE
jgi:GDPmannose 4,6-dehydratase